MPNEILIKGGLVVDGTGAAGRMADVAVRDGRIVAVEQDISTRPGGFSSRVTKSIWNSVPN